MSTAEKDGLTRQTASGRSHSPDGEHSVLNYKSLREQVYEYLRGELHSGRLLPGASINLGDICTRLRISRTPLRDALLQLAAEGFVTITPRRGACVNILTMDDIRNSFEIVGALEAAVIESVFDRFQPVHVEKMRRLNASIREVLEKHDFENYFELNVAFHRVFHDLSDNVMLQRIIRPIQQRLYDFPRRNYIQEWELRNCGDHEVLIDAIVRKDRDAAVRVWKDVHWSLSVYEEYVREFYFA